MIVDFSKRGVFIGEKSQKGDNMTSHTSAVAYTPKAVKSAIAQLGELIKRKRHVGLVPYTLNVAKRV